MKSGTVPPAEIAGYLGMLLQTLMSVHAHHQPDYREHAAKAASGQCMGGTEIEQDDNNGTGNGDSA